MQNQPIAYSMYDLGDNNLWNEIAFRDNIVNNSQEKYHVYALKINDLKFDSHTGDLTLGMESSRSGANYAFTLFYQTAIDSFVRANNVEGINELKGQQLIGLFSPKNDLKWIIAYQSRITQDDLNVTRIDVGDFSHLPKNRAKRLDDLLGE